LDMRKSNAPTRGTTGPVGEKIKRYVILNRCLGITRNLQRCRRVGNWRMFCAEHRRQPIVWVTFIIFTIIAGSASIYAVLFPTSTQTEKVIIQPQSTKIIIDKRRDVVPIAALKDHAWLVIEPLKPIPRVIADGKIGASFDYELYIKNVGKKEARNITIRANRVTTDRDMGDNVDQIRRVQNTLMRENLGENDRIAKTLAPNAQSTVPFRLSGQEPQLFSKGGFYSFLVGRIEYQDSSSKGYWMTFCYFVSNQRGDLLNCKEGNDFDSNR
jgi:hypothetical protein